MHDLLGPFEERHDHVHAHMLDLLRLTAVSMQILVEVEYGFVVAPPRGKLLPFGPEVVHDGDVLLTLLRASLVKSDLAYLTHFFLGTGAFDVESNAPPQTVALPPQLLGRLGHRKFFAQGQRQGFKEQGKAAALARPGHRYLGGFAASGARHTGDLGVQPGLLLEEAQVPPGFADSVVYALIGTIAVGAGQTLGRAIGLEFDATLGGAELHLFDMLRRLQAQGCGD